MADTKQKSKLQGIEAQIQKVREQASQLGKQTTEFAKKKGKLGIAKEAEKTTSEIVANQLDEGVNLDVSEIEPEEEAPDAADATTSALSDFTATQASVEKLTEQYQTAMEKTQERLEEAQKKEEGFFKKLLKQEEERKPTAEIRQEKLEEYGVPEDIEDIRALTTSMEPLRDKMVNLEAQQQKEIDQLYAKSGRTSWASSEERKIKRKYQRQKATVSAQLKAKAAQAQALQGNVNLARTLASEAVSAATYDEETSYNRIKNFVALNQDHINQLRQDEQSFLQSALQLRLSTLKQKRGERNQIMEWSMNYPQQFKGADLTEISLEDATELARAGAQQAQVAEGVEGGLEGGLEEGLDLGGFFSPQELREIRREGIDPTTSSGFQEALDFVAKEGDWSMAEDNIKANLKAGNTSQGQLSSLYARISKETRLSNTEIRSLFNAYGIREIGGTGWRYTPIETGEPQGKNEGFLKGIWGSVFGE